MWIFLGLVLDPPNPANIYESMFNTMKKLLAQKNNEKSNNTIRRKLQDAKFLNVLAALLQKIVNKQQTRVISISCVK